MKASIECDATTHPAWSQPARPAPACRHVTARGYNPAIVVLQRGVPAEWTFRARKLDKENYRLVFPAYQARLELNDGDNLITLTPERSGST